MSTRRHLLLALVLVPALLPVAVAVQADEEVLDPYHQAVETYQLASSASAVVPRTVIAKLCGDDDGCTFRITGHVLEGFSAPASAVATRFLSMDEYGLVWKVFDADALVTSGTLFLAPDDDLVGFAVGGAYGCALTENMASTEYRVVAIHPDLSADGVRCTLRIDD
jgi:hypothetical protein